MDMKSSINVKRTFKINGKEYNSTEEMSAGLRETFKKAMASHADSARRIDPAAARTKIVFNGTEYESIDAMPQDVRRLYEKIVKAAETGGASPEIYPADIPSGRQRETESRGAAQQEDIPQPPKFKTSFSPRTLAVIFMLSGLLLLLYYFWQSR
jgi:hypothetical protein